MDEIYLDYDPRNASFGIPPGFGFAMPGIGLRKPTQLPIYAPQPQPQPKPVYYPSNKVKPVFYQQPQQQPIYISQPVAAPDSALRRRLSDLTLGDVVPLLAHALIAFRPMPVAPSDAGGVEPNVVNLTKFVDAIGRKFHVDQQLTAAGAFAGTFLR